MFKKLRKKILIAGLALSATSAPIITPILTSPPAIAAEAKNGVVTENGDRVLYINGAKQAGTGIKKYNGKNYYIKDSKVAGEIVTNLSGWYEIHSAVKGKTNYVIDVNGADFNSGTETGTGGGNIQMYKDNNTIAQRFFFSHKGNGVYTIGTGTGDHKKNIDVVSGKKNANIRQWDINTANAQKFIVIKNFEGSLNFINVSTGQAIDIEGNDNFDNGRNVWDYTYMFGKDKGQNFSVTKICNTGELPFNPSNFSSGWYYIRPKHNTSFYLDTSSNKSDNGTNIQLWKNSGSQTAQRFYIKNLGKGLYQILTGSTNGGSAVDVSVNTGNVIEWAKHDGNNQKWKLFKYKDGTVTFVSAHTGKALDVSGDANYTSGRNVGTYDFKNSNNGLYGIEGEVWQLTKTDAPTGWIYNGSKYINKGTTQKGLQKINNTWYLFNKSSGKKEQSGDKIRVGSFFQAQSNINNRFFVTLDGANFVHSSNFAQTTGRDMNFIARDGVFYGLCTGFSNPKTKSKTKPYYDFVIKTTKDFKTYNRHPITDSYTYTERKDRWAPEWFEDTNGKTYVFYSVNKGSGIRNKNETTNFTIYRSQATDLKNYKFTKPVEMKFNTFPQYGYFAPHGNDWMKGFIDACVVKNGNTYVMFAKDEHQNQGDQARGEAMWVYTSTDLTNWKLWYKIPKNVLPQTPISLNGRSYNRYWEGQNVIKIGNTWHFYADEMMFDRSAYDGGKWMDSSRDDMYSGRLIHLTSTDLRNWTNRGYINTGGLKVRHGSVMTVKDAKSEEVIKNIFNR